MQILPPSVSFRRPLLPSPATLSGVALRPGNVLRAFLSPALTTALLLVATVPVSAQRFPSFGGLEVRLGVVSPENAESGLELAADLDLGALGIGGLRVLAGLQRFSVDVDRVAAEGDYSATGGRLGLRLDLLGQQRFSPFVGAALTAHNVSADVSEPETDELLDGFYAGAGLSAGAAWDLDTRGRYSAVFEVRRTVASNIDHTAFELGVRWHPRGTGTYELDDGG